MTSSEALRRCEFDRDALRFEVASLTPLRDLLLSVDMNAFKFEMLCSGREDVCDFLRMY
jgi:hypothetical protein